MDFDLPDGSGLDVFVDKKTNSVFLVVKRPDDTIVGQEIDASLIVQRACESKCFLCGRERESVHS